MAENRGGPRPATPGRLYPNRRDMAAQPARAPVEQEYGKAGQQLSSQSVQPVAGAPSTPLPGMAPGQVPTLTDPSARPDEPVTAGIPSGPGPGPEALHSASFGPQELSVMRGIFLKYPNDDLRRLIEWTEQNLG